MTIVLQNMLFLMSLFHQGKNSSIISMRNEISELKQWIMMLQKNAEVQIEGDNLAEHQALEVFQNLDLDCFKASPDR